MMGDDGVAVAVVEQLFHSLDELEIEVIIGETDTDYCMAHIEEGDILLILDAGYSGRTVGRVWSVSLLEAIQTANICSSQHDVDIINAMKIKGLKVSGLLICIEVSDICFRWGLSTELKQRLPEICSEINDLIIKYRRELENA